MHKVFVCSLQHSSLLIDAVDCFLGRIVDGSGQGATVLVDNATGQTKKRRVLRNYAMAESKLHMAVQFTRVERSWLFLHPKPPRQLRRLGLICPHNRLRDHLLHQSVCHYGPCATTDESGSQSSDWASSYRILRVDETDRFQPARSDLSP